MLGQGFSKLVFGFDHAQSRDKLEIIKPSRFEDLIAVLALSQAYYAKDLFEKYDARKNVSVEIPYLLPELKPILEETYGVIVYKEQFIQIVSTVAGYSFARADHLLRDIGKRKSVFIDKERAHFIKASTAKGFLEIQVTKIFNILDPISAFVQLKSHFVGHAKIAFQTGFLKANYPTEFIAAHLQNTFDNPEKLNEILREAKRMGVSIRLNVADIDNHKISVENGVIQLYQDIYERCFGDSDSNPPDKY